MLGLDEKLFTKPIPRDGSVIGMAHNGVGPLQKDVLIHPAIDAFGRVPGIKDIVVGTAAHQGLEDGSFFLWSVKLGAFFKPDVFKIAVFDLYGFNLLRIIGATKNDLIPKREIG